MSHHVLQQLQKNFQHYLLSQDSAFIDNIISDNNSAEIRLAIYKNAYVLRLLEALRCDYPVVAQYLGENAFDSLGKKYIQAHPSRYRSIRWFGQMFPGFVQSLLHGDNVFLLELAVFEQAQATAFDAINDPLVSEAYLQKISPEKWAGITFKLHASLQILSLQWNAVPAWKAAHLSSAHLLKPKKYQRTQKWLIWRETLETYFIKLKSAEAWALEAAKEKKSFGEICEGLGRWVSQEQLICYAAGLLKSWVHKGLITAIEIN